MVARGIGRNEVGCEQVSERVGNQPYPETCIAPWGKAALLHDACSDDVFVCVGQRRILQRGGGWLASAEAWPCHLLHAVCEWVSLFQRIAAGPRMRIGYVAGGLKQAANPLIRSSSLSACATCDCERLAEVDPIPLPAPQFSHRICI